MKADERDRIELGAVLPGEPDAVRFLNTLWADRVGPHDDLATAGHADLWLVSAGRGAPRALTQDEAVSLRALRDALRCLAAHRTKDPRERPEPTLTTDDALELVSSVAGAAVPGPRIALGAGAALDIVRPGPRDVGDVLAALAREGIEALAGPDALPLRACLAPSCVLYYVQDHPRRAWCSAGCGNRARAARHYARTRAEAR